MQGDITYENLFSERRLYLFFSFVLLICIFAGLWLDAYYLVLFPFALAIGFLGLIDISKLYFLLVFLLPITIEIYLPNGLGIDLPGEPILIALTALSPFLLILKWNRKFILVFTHPITLLLFFHIFWILIAAILSKDIFISIKFFLAKLWYVIPFYFLTIYILRDKINYKIFFWSLLIPLTLSILYVMVRHAATGFSFSEINSSVSPIYRNHVNYGLLMVVFLPYVWAFSQWYKEGSLLRILLYGIGGLMLIAIYFTYTRAAQLSVFLGIGIYVVIKYRWAIHAFLMSIVVALFLVIFLISGDRYLEFAPQYEKAITHENFDNLLEATVKMEDISTVERVNRWIAGYHMVKEEPFKGFGPNNFFFNYKSYMVRSFTTYVSDNPDNSGIHNYYLMTLVEQGFPGLIIFIGLLFVVVLTGSRIYHQITDLDYQRLVMAAIISIILIAIVILINDLLEAIKVGGMFFIGLGILVREDIRQRRKSSAFSVHIQE